MSAPDRVTPEVPSCTALAVETPAGPELTWTLHPAAASSTTARDTAAGRALRRSMDGVLLSGNAFRGTLAAGWPFPHLPVPGKISRAWTAGASPDRRTAPGSGPGIRSGECQWGALASGDGHHPDSRLLARRLIVGRDRACPRAGGTPHAPAHAARHAVRGRRPGH